MQTLTIVKPTRNLRERNYRRGCETEMNGGGGCVVRYSAARGGGGFGEIAYRMSKVDRIMLKFRPIAPKPMAAGSASSCSTVNYDGRHKRRKRKYVRVNGNKKQKDTNTTTGLKKRKVFTSSSESSGGGDAVVTLPLMPETPDRKENCENRDRNKPETVCSLLSFNKGQAIHTSQKSILAPTVSYQQAGFDTLVLSPPSQTPPSPRPKKLEIRSIVTVESVTETWFNGVMNMDMDTDTCPSFVTDSRDEVVWTNKAYKKMTSGGGGGCLDDATVAVKKFNRVTVPTSRPAFTCKVKVTWARDGVTSPLAVTAPCDVWRLRGGGYAWRLDVTAALCLGRGS